MGKRRHSEERWRWALAHFNGRCHWCASAVSRDLPHSDPNRATLDHIVPVSKGGLNQRQNLALSCYKCNQEKADKAAAEWLPAPDQLQSSRARMARNAAALLRGKAP